MAENLPGSEEKSFFGESMFGNGDNFKLTKDSSSNPEKEYSS